MKAREGAVVELVISRGPPLCRRTLKANWLKAVIAAVSVGIVVVTGVLLVTSGIFLGKPEGKRVAAEKPSTAAPDTAASPPAPTIADLAVKKSVPDVVGLPEKAAVRELEAAGFSAELENRESESAKKRLVIEQRPAAGTKWDINEEVVLIVSAGESQTRKIAGAKERLYPVPSVGGMAEANARSRLKNAGFDVNVGYRYHDTVPAGFVIAQAPSGSARPNATVTVYVSAGPKGRTPTSDKSAASCPGCGAPRTPGAKFCGKCGYKFTR